LASARYIPIYPVKESVGIWQWIKDPPNTGYFASQSQSLPGDARHLGSISKLKKETLLLRPFKVHSFLRGNSTRIRTIGWRTTGEHDQRRLNSTKLCTAKVR
jgi:hypothetical protein